MLLWYKRCVDYLVSRWVGVYRSWWIENVGAPIKYSPSNITWNVSSSLDGFSSARSIHIKSRQLVDAVTVVSAAIQQQVRQETMNITTFFIQEGNTTLIYTTHMWTNIQYILGRTLWCNRNGCISTSIGYITLNFIGNLFPRIICYLKDRRSLFTNFFIGSANGSSAIPVSSNSNDSFTVDEENFKVAFSVPIHLGEK